MDIQGKDYWPNSQKIKYIGSFKDNKYNGRGKLYYNDGQTVQYEGEFILGWFGGKGRLYRRDGTLWYDGEFYDGQRNGQGIEYYQDGTTIKYEGRFVNGVWSGNVGDSIQAAISVPENLIEENAPEAVSEKLNQNTYIEEKIYREDGTLLYFGSISNDKKYHGRGILYFPDGETPRYVGEFINGKYCGYGKRYYKNGMLRYEGTFADNKENGTGKEYDQDGCLKYEGTFRDGHYVEEN